MNIIIDNNNNDNNNNNVNNHNNKIFIPGLKTCRIHWHSNTIQNVKF